MSSFLWGFFSGVIFMAVIVVWYWIWLFKHLDD